MLIRLLSRSYHLYLFSYVALSTCTPCSTISGCSQCSNTQALCSSCQSNFYLDYSTSIFSLIQADNQCVACTINHCLACADGPICFSCENGFIPDPVDSKTCIPCSVDSFSFNNTCHQCESNITGCTRCSYNGSAVKCSRCKTHWALHSSSLLCIDCQQIPNCIQCSDFDICSKCKRPYLLSSTGSCDSCESGLEYFNNVCNIKGCLNALPDYSRCIACRANNNYFYDSFKKSCICNSGYNSVKLQTATVCSSSCGNGIATPPEQQCDDSNRIDNDGCDRNCKIQPGFDCLPTLPNKCLLHYQIQDIKYNYAFKVQGKSRGKFSFSLLPFHEVFQYVNWSKYITFNISDDFVKRQTMIHYFKYETKEICIEFDYKKQIQNLVVIATFKFVKSSSDSSFKSSSVQLVQLSNQYQKLVGTAVVSVPPQIIAEPSQTSLQIKLRGVNSALSFEEERIIQAYKASQIGFIAISIVVLLFFFVGSYSHKMIGLQTIQILQYFYFMGMIVDDNSKTSLKSMNVLKYTAFGGYSSYTVFFGDISQQIQSLTYQTVDRNFIYVGLMKYFVINVNLSLVIPILALAIYGVYLTRKLRNRSKYIQFRQQINKDLHTVYKRSTQWVYDHCLFPLVNIFSMISFFCTILQLDIKAKSSQNANHNEAILQIVEKSNFALNLFFVFLTFFIFTFQVFVSYGQFKYANMTEEQKSRNPSSMIEQLEYDANNPDAQNYKHGYVLVYLLFYLLLQIVLMMSVLIKEMSRYGIEIMLGLQFVYLLILWIWQPYYPIVNFHNKALKFNHLTVFFFTLTCECLQRIDIPPQVEVTLIFLSLFMLIGVFFGGTIRVYLEFQFRRNMSQNSNILDLKKEIKKLNINPKLEKMSIKQRYLLNNKYVYNFEDLKTSNYNQKIEDGSNLRKYRQSDKLDKYFLRDIEVQKAKLNFVNDFAGLNHRNKLKNKLQQHEPESLFDLKMRMKRSQRQLF